MANQTAQYQWKWNPANRYPSEKLEDYDDTPAENYND